VQKQYISAYLSSLPLFEGMPEAFYASAMENTQTKKYAKGERILILGEASPFVHVITSGWVKLFRETFDGEEVVIDVMSEGSFFGEEGLFNEGVCSYGAEAVQDTQVIMIPRQALADEVARKDSSLALNILKCMMRKKNAQDMEVEHRTAQSAPQRIGCFLLKTCKPSQGPAVLRLPYDKSVVAARLGMQPETFS